MDGTLFLLTVLWRGVQREPLIDTMCKETPARAGGRTAKILKFTLLAVFVATRALHPMLIDWSKEGGKIRYGKTTPVVMNKIITVSLMNAVAFAYGGTKGVAECWQPKYLFVFGMIGAMYAMGDYLEMLSMSSLSGGVYQTLLQSKLLITAIMLWWIKGTKQSKLQWHVLFAMFLAMSSFVIMDQDSKKASSGGGSSFPPLGAVFSVMLKVAVSCYCAVLSEKYLKAHSDMPLYAKISGISFTWAIISVLISLCDQGIVQKGFFAHWNGITCLVTLSFVCKTVLTMSLLQALDSVQKNIGEALAVLAIYISQASMEGGFELSIFLVAILVVALVKTYGLSSPKKSTLAHGQKLVPMAKRVEIVSMNTEGTPLMMSVGISTVRCEVKDDLPIGVFYGMLGAAHPVCGNTDGKDRKRCELMLLNREPSPKHRGELPFLPTECLTVLGQLDALVPRDVLTSQHFSRLADESREKILALCMGSGGMP